MAANSTWRLAAPALPWAGAAVGPMPAFARNARSGSVEERVSGEDGLSRAAVYEAREDVRSTRSISSWWECTSSFA